MIPDTGKIPLPLSVVVCAKNELDNLQQLIPILLEQDYAGSFEVVIVNDASTDGTLEHLNKIAANKDQLKIIHLKEGEKKGIGKKAALAIGIEQAKYKHLVFTDGDCLPTGKQWLAKMGAALQHSDLILGYGPLRNTGGLVGAVSRWEAAYVAAQYIAFSEAGHPYMAVGRNMAYTKSLYKSVDGFKKHEGIASGDDDLFLQSTRNQVRPLVLISPESFVYSDTPINWKAWLRQKRRHLSTSYRYDFGNKLILGSLGVMQLFLFLLLPMALFYSFTYSVLLLFIRLLSRYVHTYIAFKRLQSLDVWLKGPLYAFVSVLATTLSHLHQLVYKKPINWK